ncbi:hypothetical protein NK983_33315, partial [Salmonella enterica subsp. enterica serovar Typhimurium]|nr:hypothetical protein [Salmonella enterica subsp. enterica serovar Typhimurium]
VFFGQDFEGRMYEENQSRFEQDMLAKGDVRKIVIVNQKFAEVTIDNDSLALPRYSYIDKKSGKILPYFPNAKAAPGPHFRVS